MGSLRYRATSACRNLAHTKIWQLPRPDHTCSNRDTSLPGVDKEAVGPRRTSTRAPLLMLRGVLRVDCMVMRLLDAWSAPFAAFAIAKLLGAADALALVLTPADSLHSTMILHHEMPHIAHCIQRGGVLLISETAACKKHSKVQYRSMQDQRQRHW